MHIFILCIIRYIMYAYIKCTYMYIYIGVLAICKYASTAYRYHLRVYGTRRI